MSAISSMIAGALSTLGTALGQTTYSRSTQGASWTAMPGALLVPMDPVPVMDDAARHTIEAPQFAAYRVPLNAGLPLLNAGAGGAQVKDQSGTIWAVVSVSYRVSLTQYTCKRASLVDAGQPAGRV